MLFSPILTVATFAVANAHFTLEYPPTRGFDESQEPNFCGGFSLGNRSQFPLEKGIVSITSHHPKAEVDVIISFDSNPMTFDNFNKTSSGTPIKFLVPFTQMDAQGEACFPVNISSLGIPEAHDGANATLMVQFNGGDGNLYQCADLVLSSGFNVPNGTQCVNATGAFTSSSLPVIGGIPSALTMILTTWFGMLTLYVLGL